MNEKHRHEWVMITPNEMFEVAKCRHCQKMLHADDAERRLNATEVLSAEDAWLLADDIDNLIVGYDNERAMGCGAAYDKLVNYARILED